MPVFVLWDSSAILAAVDARDEHHTSAAASARTMAGEGFTGFITNYIEAEAHALLLSRLGRQAALDWLMAGNLAVQRVLAAEEARARAILARYADKDWSLCDAISFAVMEARGVRDVFTYDAHFRQWGKVRVRG